MFQSSRCQQREEDQIGYLILGKNCLFPKVTFFYLSIGLGRLSAAVEDLKKMRIIWDKGLTYFIEPLLFSCTSLWLTISSKSDPTFQDLDFSCKGYKATDYWWTKEVDFDFYDAATVNRDLFLIYETCKLLSLMLSDFFFLIYLCLWVECNSLSMLI